ncbi:hypothetical protein QZJ86_01120 [Methylomonas montana]|uniref:hypothetical protein n=1 Tax=Methylomonas montana TaxID=3058963 RepID=UPI00265A7054|nr:hypothetical protein [Methylomonas montana]WKJ90767.1 hypothetical protein QZJ86_01120 [Methylomonas montana]
MDETYITIEYLREILAKCGSTTPGPWVSFIEGRDHDSGSSFIRTAGNDIELSGATDADQDFMANAKQDIPALVAEIVRLKGWSL